MHRIAPGLVIGSREDAENSALLATFSIEAILSLEPVETPDFIKAHLQLDIRDRAPLPGTTLVRALDFIRRQVAQERCVLVHCQMGISRSPAIAAAHLVIDRDINLDEAVRYLRSRRPQVAIHPELLSSVKEFADLCQRLAS